MFQSIIKEDNKIIFTETHTNVDGDEICTFIIGYGYGIFGGLTSSELSTDKYNKYNSAVAVIGYKAVNSPDITIDGVTYKQQATEPTIDKSRLKYTCSWRGATYAISGVSKKYTVNGEFAGYRVYSSND